MSIDQDWNNASETPRPPRSALKTVLIVLGIGAGLCLLLCCGGLIFIGMNAERIADVVGKKMFSDDPQEVRRRTQDIVEIDIPPEFQPQGAIDAFVMKMVVYQQEPLPPEDAPELPADSVPPADATTDDEMPAEPEDEPQPPAAPSPGTLIIAHFSALIAKDPNLTPEKLQQQIEEQHGDQPQVRITKTENREFEIRGQKVAFQFAEGVDEQSNVPMRQISGMFPGKDGGLIMLWLVVPEARYDEEQVVRMLESIR